MHRDRELFVDAARRDRSARLRRQQKHDVWFWLLYFSVVAAAVMVIARFA